MRAPPRPARARTSRGATRRSLPEVASSRPAETRAARRRVPAPLAGRRGTRCRRALPRAAGRRVACALGVRGCGNEGSAVRASAAPAGWAAAGLAARARQCCGVASRRRRDCGDAGDDFGRRAAATLRESGQRRGAERAGQRRVLGDWSRRGSLPSSGLTPAVGPSCFPCAAPALPVSSGHSAPKQEGATPGRLAQPTATA